jgi:nitrate reductase gamma subunit
MPFRTLCVLLRRRASRTAFPRWSVRNDHLNYRATLCVVCLSGRSASSCDAELRELHSHAGACGTIISTIVRRSASYAFPDALRPLATQSVENCIPTLERSERSSQLSCDALRRMPFRTLCVLLRRRASGTAFSRWSVGNDHLNYRATLCVVCLSGRSASSCDAERRELHCHAGA